MSEHYGRDDLAAKILEALRAAGKDPDALTAEDLTPGRPAPRPGRPGAHPHKRVRLRGRGAGCDRGVCRTGTTLTTYTGLGGLVSFRHGSARDTLPRRRLRRGVDAAQLDERNHQRAPVRRDTPRAAPRRTHGDARVPGRTRLPHPFPRAVSTQSGTQQPAPSRGGARPHPRHRFRGVSLDRPYRPCPALAPEAACGDARTTIAALGLHLVLGDALGEMFRDQLRNLAERRASIVQAVFERPDRYFRELFSTRRPSGARNCYKLAPKG